MISFKKSEIKNFYIDENFLKNMVELGILQSAGHKSGEEYKFDNMLYYAYFLIKSIDKSSLKIFNNDIN